MKQLTIYTLALLLSTLSALADNVTLKVSAPSNVQAGEKFRVQYVVNTSSATNFSVPDFTGLEVIYGPSTSTQSSFQIINGQTSQSSSITYTFIVIGNKPGTYTIPQASVKVGGKSIHSSSAKVKVVGSANSSSNGGTSSNGQGHTTVPRQTSTGSGRDLFMTATLSKANVYEQEAVLLTYKIYTLVNLTQLDGKLPTLDGFQIQEVALPRNKEFSLETYKGRTYHTVVWSQYVLFPQKTGKLEIPSIKYEGIVMERDNSMDPIDAFFNGTGGMIETRRNITTPKLTINVKELPNKPKDFSGAVGQFSVSSSINSTNITTDDALTLKVLVKGVGNMKLINTPTISFPAEFETYDAKVTDNFNLTKAGLSGTKQFEYLAVPRHAGKYTIPSLDFVFFDTSTGKYKTISTQSYDITVNKGSGKGSGAVADFTNKQEKVNVLNNDIHFIKLGEASYSSPIRFFGKALYWMSYALAAILFIVAATILRHSHKASLNTIKVKGRKASKVARTKLKKANSLLKQGKDTDFYDEIMHAMHGYMSDKLNIPLESLNKDNMRTSMKETNVDDADIEFFVKTLEDCEYARFAPGNAADNMSAIYDSATEAIDRIEKSKTKK